MFALKMIQHIEAHAGQLSDELMQRLESNESCPELLQKVPRHELELRTHEIYRNLSDWLLSKTGTEIEERYLGVGTRRAKQGVPFSEFFAAITATKDVLWEYLEREDFLGDPVELLGDLDLLHSLARFFDHLSYSAAIGYEGVHKELGEHTSKSSSRMAAVPGGASQHA
jgi:hypothetical protein